MGCPMHGLNQHIPLLVTEQSEGQMDIVASRDVPPPFLEFDGGISLVIAVKMSRSHENHVQNHWVIARYAVRACTVFYTNLEP